MRNGRNRVVRVAVLGVVGALWHSAPLASQTLGEPAAPGGAETAAWLTKWSPLGLSADLPRELPGAGVSLPMLLTVPAPRVGSFWTAGNPASLPWDVRDSYAQVRLLSRNQSGDYRRPLDPGSDSRLGATALGWTDLGAGGAVIGRVVADHLRQDDGAHADVALPYSSSPFVVLDTIGDALAGMMARVEGAGGWRLGNLGIGLGLGYDGREIRTVASPAPRRYRVSATGATAGLNYALLRDLIEIGVFGAWEQLVQNTYVTSRAADTRLYLITGYFNPLLIDLQGQTYQRHSERNARSLGGSVAGRVGAVEWAAYGRRSALSERQSVMLQDEPPQDRWDADSWDGGIAATAVLGDSVLLATVSGNYSRVTGEALRWDLDEVNFEVKEIEWRIGGELRLLPRRGWTAAVRLGTGRQSRSRWDFLARVGSDLKGWMPAVSVELARSLPRGFAVSLGGGYTRHDPWGSIPTPSAMAPAYQSWIAPELSVYLNGASTVVGCATLLWTARTGLSIWAKGTLASLSPDGGNPPPLLPRGSRMRNSIEIGFTLPGG